MMENVDDKQPLGSLLITAVKSVASSKPKNRKQFIENVLKIKPVVENCKRHGFWDKSLFTIVADSSLIKAALDYYENPTEPDDRACTSKPAWENHYAIISDINTATDTSSSSDLEKTISQFPIGNNISDSFINSLDFFNEEYSNQVLPDALFPTVSGEYCESLLKLPRVQEIANLSLELGLGSIEECVTTDMAELQNRNLPWSPPTLNSNIPIKTAGAKRKRRSLYHVRKRRRPKKTSGKVMYEQELHANKQELDSSFNCVNTVSYVCDTDRVPLIEDASEVSHVNNMEISSNLLSEEENPKTENNSNISLNENFILNPSEIDKPYNVHISKPFPTMSESSTNPVTSKSVLENELPESEKSFNSLNQISQSNQFNDDMNNYRQDDYSSPNRTIACDQVFESFETPQISGINSNEVRNNHSKSDEQPQTKIKLHDSINIGSQTNNLKATRTVPTFISQNSGSGLLSYDVEDELDYEPDDAIEGSEMAITDQSSETSEHMESVYKTDVEEPFVNSLSERFVIVTDTMDSASDADEASIQVNSQRDPIENDDNEANSSAEEDKVQGTDASEGNDNIFQVETRQEISLNANYNKQLTKSSIENSNLHLDASQKLCNSPVKHNRSYNSSQANSPSKDSPSQKAEYLNHESYNHNSVKDQISFSSTTKEYRDFEVTQNRDLSSVSTKMSEDTKVSSDEDSQSDSDQSFKRQVDSSPSYPKLTVNGIQDEETSSSSNKCVPKVSSNHYDSIQDVLRNIRNLCGSSDIEKAISFATEYIAISYRNTQIKIFQELFRGILNYIKYPGDTNVGYPEMFVEKALKIFNKYKLYSKSLCSCIVLECFSVECTVNFAVGTFAYCQKEKIQLDKKAVSVYASYVDKGLSIRALLDFLEYVNQVCKLSVPVHILNKAIVQSLKGQESHLLPEFGRVCDLLCKLRTLEVDLCNLKIFIEYCIKNDCWHQVSKFFHSWTQRSKLVCLLCQALACDLKDVGLYFKKFAVAVCETDGEISHDCFNLFGQMGVTLMLEAFYSNRLKCAFEILYTLHSYKIRYGQLQEPLYTVPFAIESYLNSLTNAPDILALPHVAIFAAMEICLQLKRPKDAYQIFKEFREIEPQHLPDDLKNKAKLQYLKHLLNLTQVLHPVDPLEKGLDVFLSLLSAPADDLIRLRDSGGDMTSTFNEYLITLTNESRFQPAFQLYQCCIGVHKEVLSLKPQVWRGLVVMFARHKKMEEASNLFLLGYVKDVYRFEKPSEDTFPWHISILSSWTRWEIKFVLERYIETLLPILVHKDPRTEFEKWFGIKIIFKESDNIGSEINCLRESTTIAGVFRRTQQVLKLIDSSLTWIEYLDDKCLVINAASFYNYWRNKFLISESPSLVTTLTITGKTCFSFGQDNSPSPGNRVFQTVCNISGSKTYLSGAKNSPNKISPRRSNLPDQNLVTKRQLLFNSANAMDIKSPQDKPSIFQNRETNINKIVPVSFQCNENLITNTQERDSYDNADGWAHLSKFRCRKITPSKQPDEISPPGNQRTSNISDGSFNSPASISFLQKHMPLQSSIQQILPRQVPKVNEISPRNIQNGTSDRDVNGNFPDRINHVSSLVNHSPEHSVFKEPPQTRMKITREQLGQIPRRMTPSTPKQGKDNYYHITTPAQICRVRRRPITPITKNVLLIRPKTPICMSKNLPASNQKKLLLSSALKDSKKKSKFSFDKNFKDFTISLSSHLPERKVSKGSNKNKLVENAKPVSARQNQDLQITRVFHENNKPSLPGSQSSWSSCSSLSVQSKTPMPTQVRHQLEHTQKTTEDPRIKQFLKTQVMLKWKSISPEEQQNEVENLAQKFVQSHVVDKLDSKTMKMLHEFARKFINS